MIRIEPDELSAEALDGVVDAFILREGTDYGHLEVDFADKRARVLAAIRSGTAAIFYDPENDFVDIQLTD